MDLRICKLQWVLRQWVVRLWDRFGFETCWLKANTPGFTTFTEQRAVGWTSQCDNNNNKIIIRQIVRLRNMSVKSLQGRRNTSSASEHSHARRDTLTLTVIWLFLSHLRPMFNIRSPVSTIANISTGLDLANRTSVCLRVIICQLQQNKYALPSSGNGEIDCLSFTAYCYRSKKLPPSACFFFNGGSSLVFLNVCVEEWSDVSHGDGDRSRCLFSITSLMKSAKKVIRFQRHGSDPLRPRPSLSPSWIG